MDVTFRDADAGEPPASELIAAMLAEIAGLYGPVEHAVTPSATPAELSPPDGGCLVGWTPDGEPVAVGGLKRLDERTVEFKRMWVAPQVRRRGVARALLAAMEAKAAELGYPMARLDTGPAQGGARALYVDAGYREIPDYNGNELASFWGEKEL
jgi:GNAT superfamily N-acetyltransferase